MIKEWELISVSWIKLVNNLLSARSDMYGINYDWIVGAEENHSTSANFILSRVPLNNWPLEFIAEELVPWNFNSEKSNLQPLLDHNSSATQLDSLVVGQLTNVPERSKRVVKQGFTSVMQVNEMVEVQLTDKSSCEGEKDLISIKTDLTSSSDSSINDFTVQWDFEPTAECQGFILTQLEYLSIPEGITRIPFGPLPEILLRSVPIMQKSMNYYQRKAARYQPISPSAKSKNDCPRRFNSPGIFSPKYQCSVLSKLFSRTNIGDSPTPQTSSPGFGSPAFGKTAFGLKTGSTSPFLSSPRSLNYYQKKNFIFEPQSKQRWGVHSSWSVVCKRLQDIIHTMLRQSYTLVWQSVS